MKTIRWTGALLLMAALGSARADFNEGVIAHMKGDYATALQTMLPLAETAHHPLAQYYVGMMYANGQGTQQDLQAAGRWFESAARQGIAQAQLRIGEMYASGKGMPVDFERAYAWLSLAKQRGQAKAQATLDQVTSKLVGADLGEAKKLADQYASQYSKTPDADAEGHGQ